MSAKVKASISIDYIRFHTKTPYVSLFSFFSPSSAPTNELWSNNLYEALEAINKEVMS